MMTGSGLTDWLDARPVPVVNIPRRDKGTLAFNLNILYGLTDWLDARPVPVVNIPRRDKGTLAFNLNILFENEEQVDNEKGVTAHMVELMRVPTIKAGAVIPDACPAGSAPGTIPV